MVGKRCCLMLFVVKSEWMMGCIIKPQRQKEIETTVFGFYYLPNLAYCRTCLLHSAAGFSLETKTILVK